jgi:uncharacterized metal-binding protein
VIQGENKMAEKVTLQPCLNQDKLSVLARQACYVVHEDYRPEQTALGCGPALNAKVQEDVDFIQLYPVIAIESCPKDCATKLIAKMGSKATLTIRMPDLLKELGIDAAAIPEHHIDCEAAEVQAVAKHLLVEVDRLLDS